MPSQSTSIEVRRGPVADQALSAAAGPAVTTSDRATGRAATTPPAAVTPAAALSSPVPRTGAEAGWGTAALTHGPLDSDRAGNLAGAFKALGDPVRLRLLSMIASAEDGEICVCDLSDAFPLTGPTISHHLRILREAGLVLGARRGTWVYYRAVPGQLVRLAGVLDGSRPAAVTR